MVERSFRDVGLAAKAVAIYSFIPMRPNVSLQCTQRRAVARGRSLT